MQDAIVPCQECANRARLPHEAFEEIKHQVMRTLAKRYTAPENSTGYQDPADVRTLFEMAKAKGTKQAWKEAHHALRKTRMEWAKERLEDAAQLDWRDARRRKTKVGRGWEMGFSQHQTEQGVEPHDCIHKHSESIFNTADAIGDQFEREFLPSRDFTEQELTDAVSKTKLGKSVGVDETSAELGLWRYPSRQSPGPSVDLLLLLPSTYKLRYTELPLNTIMVCVNGCIAALMNADRETVRMLEGQEVNVLGSACWRAELLSSEAPKLESGSLKRPDQHAGFGVLSRRTSPQLFIMSPA